MTITPHSIPRTEYRDADKMTICIAEPGKVFVSGHQMKSLAELEEFIVTLRQAASEAQLPSLKPKEPVGEDRGAAEEGEGLSAHPGRLWHVRNCFSLLSAF
jgi:hypothetical protein